MMEVIAGEGGRLASFSEGSDCAAGTSVTSLPSGGGGVRLAEKVIRSSSAGGAQVKERAASQPFIVTGGAINIAR